MGETEISSVENTICTVSNDSAKVSSSPEPQTDKQDGSSPVKMRQCTECGKKFSKASKLRTHMFIHSGERPFVCTHEGCDKAYTSTSHLLRHQKSHQKREVKQMHMCQQCKALFVTPGGLRKHTKTIHESEVKNYPCKDCGMAFRKRKLLNQHRHQHGADPAFRCQICTLSFPLKHLFNRHMRGHKTHPCRVPGCTVVLANWSLYRKHIAEHNSKKGKECPICDKHLPNRQTLFDHMELHRERGFECPYPPCTKVYQHKRNLNHHVQTTHVGVRYVCDYEDCQVKFITKQKLLCHARKVHGNEDGSPPSLGPDSPKPKSAKARARRKDVGTVKRAMAPRLAGLCVPYSEEKRLLEEDRNPRKEQQSPESGLASLSGSTSEENTPEKTGSGSGRRVRGDDLGATTEPSDASDLQGPSETQRRNEDPHETSSDESFVYSGGESSDDDSGSGHCDDDDDEDGDGEDGGDDDHDEEEGDDDDFHDDDDEGEDDDDEGEEGNGLGEQGNEQPDDVNHPAQGDGSNGKRAESESLSRDEIHDGAGDLGVDRDGTVPTADSCEVGSLDSGENERTSSLSPYDGRDDSLDNDDKADDSWEEERNQRVSKRKHDDDYEVARKKRRDESEVEDDSPNMEVMNASPCRDETPVEAEPPLNVRHLDRNVDPKIFEVSLSKEKASKKLPEEVWLSTFRKSINNCLPVDEETDDDYDYPLTREVGS